VKSTHKTKKHFSYFVSRHREFEIIFHKVSRSKKLRKKVDCGKGSRFHLFALCVKLARFFQAFQTLALSAKHDMVITTSKQLIRMFCI
jgi:hypothetical protein